MSVVEKARISNFWGFRTLPWRRGRSYDEPQWTRTPHQLIQFSERNSFLSFRDHDDDECRRRRHARAPSHPQSFLLRGGERRVEGEEEEGGGEGGGGGSSGEGGEVSRCGGRSSSHAPPLRHPLLLAAAAPGALQPRRQPHRGAAAQPARGAGERLATFRRRPEKACGADCSRLPRFSRRQPESKRPPKSQRLLK